VNNARFKNTDSQRQRRLAKGIQDYKEITLEQAINPTVIKLYYEQFKKEFNRPSVFEKGRSQDC